MMQTAARSRITRAQTAVTKSIPAPVGGLNDRDPLGAMAENYAVILDNFWCLPSKVVLRNGCSSWATGLAAQVESIMGYRPATGTPLLFAAAGTSFFNSTSTGAVGAAVVTGLTNARWQHVNMATSGGNFLMAVNGADKLRGWDGSAWWTDGGGLHDITGVDTATCIDINLFKRRMWLIKGNSTSAYYGPVDSIAGAFTELPFGSIFSGGGKLKKMVNWSIDAGIGIDDYAAFISTEGEVALYKGSDPSSATTWALVGLFQVGSPIGQRCAVQYGKDVLLLGKDGLVPLSVALLTQRLLSNIALTDKVQNAIGTATTLYGNSFGWEIVPFPGENMILLNVPVSVGTQIQYAMNTISGAWARFTGWPSNCYELYGDELYYGGNGVVFKAWSTRADAGSNINSEALGAFNYFGSKGLKYFTLARPAISLTAGVGLNIGLNTDFDQTAPTGVPTVSAGNAATWGVSKWGVGLWGGNPVAQKSWYSAVGEGYCAALHIKAASNSGQFEWAATDHAFTRGGVL